MKVNLRQFPTLHSMLPKPQDVGLTQKIKYLSACFFGVFAICYDFSITLSKKSFQFLNRHIAPYAKEELLPVSHCIIPFANKDDSSLMTLVKIACSVLLVVTLCIDIFYHIFSYIADFFCGDQMILGPQQLYSFPVSRPVLNPEVTKEEIERFKMKLNDSDGTVLIPNGFNNCFCISLFQCMIRANGFLESVLGKKHVMNGWRIVLKNYIKEALKTENKEFLPVKCGDYLRIQCNRPNVTHCNVNNTTEGPVELLREIFSYVYDDEKKNPFMLTETIQKRTPKNSFQSSFCEFESSIQQPPASYPTIPIYLLNDCKEHNEKTLGIFCAKFLCDEAAGRRFSKVYENGPPPFLVFEANAYNYILPQDLKEGKKKKDEKKTNFLSPIPAHVTIPEKYINGGNKPAKYKLSSILLHKGGKFDQLTKDRDGHYFSTFKVGNSWHICDSLRSKYLVASDEVISKFLKHSKDCHPQLKDSTIRMLIYNLTDEKKEAIIDEKKH